MTAIEFYKFLQEKFGYSNEEINDALADEERGQAEKEIHTLCCLELDRLNIFKLVLPEEWHTRMDGANFEFCTGKIDYCVQYLIKLEKEKQHA